MGRFENLRAALSLAKQDMQMDSREMTKYEVALILNLVLNVFLLIATLAILNLEVTSDDFIRYVLQIVFISIVFIALIISVVFIMLGLIHRKYQGINSTIYLKCNESEEEYLLKVLFDYQTVRKNNLEVIAHLRKCNLATLISFIISILSYISLIIVLLV